MFRLSRLGRLLFSALALALLMLPSSIPSQAAPAASGSSNVPTPLFPNGTLPIRRMIYIWSEVAGATRYQLQAYRGSNLILDRTLEPAVCVSGTCAYRHDTDLTNDNYTWKIRAAVGGVNHPYSPSMAFTVAAPAPSGFYSPFTDNADGWVIHRGIWQLEASNYFTTAGVQGRVSSVSHIGEYSTLTYEVRMKRTGCRGNANALAIRGNPVLDSVGWWKTEYTFDYTNTGYFSVWKDYNGTYTALRNWTYTSAINRDGWNVLKVKASGSSLYFYINNILVWSGSDSAYPSGRVGIAMYRGPSCTGDKLWVDYAKLETTVGDLPPADLVIQTDEPTPGGTRHTAP